MTGFDPRMTGFRDRGGRWRRLTDGMDQLPPRYPRPASSITPTGKYHIVGRTFYDPDGVQWIPRGVNVGATIANNNNGWPDYAENVSYIDGMKAWGINAVRMVQYATSRMGWSVKGKALAAGKTAAQADAEVDALADRLTKLYRSHGLVVMMECHDLTQSPLYANGALSADGKKWCDEVVEFWRRYASRWKGDSGVFMNIANEPNLDTPEWKWFHDAACSAIRSQGADNIIACDALYYASDLGRDWAGTKKPFSWEPEMIPALITKYGNVCSSSHNYGSHNVYTNATNVRNYYQAYKDANVPLLIGEIGHPNDEHATVMANQAEMVAAAKTVCEVAPDFGIGVFWWASNFKDYYWLYKEAGDVIRNEFGDPNVQLSTGGIRFRAYLDKISGAVTSTTAPVTVSNFGLTLSGTSSTTATVNWTTHNPAAGWNIGRNGTDANGGGAWSTNLPGTATSQQFTLLVPGQQYTFTLKDLSTGVTNTISFMPPVSDFKMTVTPGYNGSATVNWTTHNPAAGWNIGRNGTDSTGDGPWAENVTGATNTYTFNLLVPGQTYTFTLKDLSSGVTNTVTYTPATSTGTTTGTTTGTGTQTSTPTARASGLPWMHGVFGHIEARSEPARVAEFEAALGRQVDFVTVSPTRTDRGWEGNTAAGEPADGMLQDTWWLTIAPSDVKIIDVAVPLWQKDETLAGAAAGSYNSYWTRLGKMVGDKYPGSTIRPGWEFNLTNWYWGATPGNVSQWIAAWKHAYTSIKAGSPNVLVMWNPNAGYGSSDRISQAETAYPGDAYVDIIGLDSYDWDPPYVNDSNWAIHRDGYGEWKHWLDFARAHGKQFMAPEFGLANKAGATNQGHDNPLFFQYLMPLLEQYKDVIRGISYFDETDTYMLNSIAAGQVPKGAAEYKRQLDAIAARYAATPPPTTGGTTTTGSTTASNYTYQERNPEFTTSGTWQITSAFTTACDVTITDTATGAVLSSTTATPANGIISVPISAALAEGARTATVKGIRPQATRSATRALFGDYLRSGRTSWAVGLHNRALQQESGIHPWEVAIKRASDLVLRTTIEPGQGWGPTTGTPGVTTGMAWNTWAMTKTAVHQFGRPVIGMASFPSNLGIASNSPEQATMFDQIAAGQYDWCYQQIARNLVANNLGSAIVRLDWEGNGGWYHFGTSDSTNVVKHGKAVAHIIEKMLDIAPNLKFPIDVSSHVWNKTVGSSGMQWLRDYNPQQYGTSGRKLISLINCDIYFVSDKNIGVSPTYDQFLAMLDPTNLQKGTTLKHAYDYSVEIGVPLCIAEWGIADTGHNGTGDAPAYIDHMFRWISEHPNVAYDAYFMYDKAVPNDLLTNLQTLYPQSWARYQALWSQQ